MSETIKCTCPSCGAKYRLPVEAQGRRARCKRCGEKFDVPRQENLEDSILTWLSAPTEEEAEEAVPAPPRVINMPAANPAEASDTARKMRGPIRMKDAASKGETG